MFVKINFNEFEKQMTGYFSKSAIKALYTYFEALGAERLKDVALDLAVVRAEWREYASLDDMIDALDNPSARHDWEISHLQTDGDFVWTEEEEEDFRQFYLKKISHRYGIHPFDDGRYLVEIDPSRRNTGCLGFISFSAF